jgi:mannosyltransferase OCH1-like enzyme
MALHKRHRYTRKRGRKNKSCKGRRRAPHRKQRGGTDYGHISRILIQTAKEPIPEKIVTKIKALTAGWDYLYFSDKDILQFFHDTPNDEFPDMTTRFNSFTSGEHKADLFRYYYLYMNGGVFMDSDLMLYDQINTIVGKNSFVSVWAKRPEGSVFNGFLGAAPKHPILHAALKDAYTTTNEQLQGDYTLFCKHMGGFVTKNMGTQVKMLKEVTNNDVFCTIEDPDSKKISLIHYQSMDIPEQAPSGP